MYYYNPPSPRVGNIDENYTFSTNFYKAYIWDIHNVSFVYCPWNFLRFSKTAPQIEIGSIEIRSQGKQANRVALSHISGFLATFYDWISDSRESYRRREISSPLTIRRNKEIGKRSGAAALSRLDLSLRSRAKDTARRVPHEFYVFPPLLSLGSDYFVRGGPQVRSRSSVYAIDAFVHRAMSIIVCPSVCLFTE